ncbi:hypothetical protein AAFF_G00102320 [Aldrovandia affinis]|uniref:Splicing regulator RBM11 n=1 Tax=Aldrovandia affinis TaxID=143900 RepID=A0AAD7WB44_9TELE|nr:hypothetical protein AAFF_G00102320 [Aldrovandia affinis]
MLAKHSEVDRTVFVGNLHSSVKEEILFELFLQAGPLKKVTIARDREGRQRSYGFVCYKHQESVPYAIALLNGIRLYGRPIRLQYSSGSSHSDGGSGPSDPPLEPHSDHFLSTHSANTVFPESPAFHFPAMPDSRCPSQDQLHWNSVVCGYPPAVPPEHSPTPTPVLLALPPSPPPGADGQTGHTDEAEPGKLRKHKKSRERRHRSEKRRSRGKASGRARARVHARAGRRAAFTPCIGEDGETPRKEDTVQ